jgi:hypothetical protein
MSFRFYANAISQASRKVAAGIFMVGLLLIGFGAVILALPEIFAFLAAAVFFAAGAGCSMTAVRIFSAQKKLERMSREDSGTYRENVQIHIEEHCD